MSTHNTILLAAQNRFGNLSEAFRDRPDSSDRGEVLVGLLIVAVLIVGVWALSRWLNLQERHRAYSSPRRLFLSLCRAHRLRWSDRWMLWRLGRSQRLKDPARLFLEPERFDATRLGPAFRRKAARLNALRDRLFAEPPKEEEPRKNAELPKERRPAQEARRPQVALPRSPLMPPGAAPVLDVPPWSSTATGVESSVTNP